MGCSSMGYLLFVIEITFNIHLLHKRKIRIVVCSWFYLLRKKIYFMFYILKIMSDSKTDHDSKTDFPFYFIFVVRLARVKNIHEQTWGLPRCVIWYCDPYYITEQVYRNRPKDTYLRKKINEKIVRRLINITWFYNHYSIENQ